MLDEAGKLIGMLSMGDILKAVHPAYMDLMNLGDFTWDGMVEYIGKKAADKKVETLMTKGCYYGKRRLQPLMECVDHMIKNNVKRVPVLDKEGKVVGMIYERDVFFEIVKSNARMKIHGGGK